MSTMPPQFPLEIRSALRRASSTVYFHRSIATVTPPSFRHRTTLFRPRCFSSSSVKLPTKPPLCTADELHYVSVPNSDWRLALWRYLPPPQVFEIHQPPFFSVSAIFYFFGIKNCLSSLRLLRGIIRCYCCLE